MSFIKSPQQLQDYLMVVSVLPVIADKLEDLIGPVFKKSLKQRANMLIEEIRKHDRQIMDSASLEGMEQQNAIAIAFRQWCDLNFNANPDMGLKQGDYLHPAAPALLQAVVKELNLDIHPDDSLGIVFNNGKIEAQVRTVLVRPLSIDIC